MQSNIPATGLKLQGNAQAGADISAGLTTRAGILQLNSGIIPRIDRTGICRGIHVKVCGAGQGDIDIAASSREVILAIRIDCAIKLDIARGSLELGRPTKRVLLQIDVARGRLYIDSTVEYILRSIDVARGGI